MSNLEIFLCVLARISVIGFIAGLIAVILKWREDGVFIWPAPIIGLFIVLMIPLFYLLEMIDFYKESKKMAG